MGRLSRHTLGSFVGLRFRWGSVTLSLLWAKSQSGISVEQAHCGFSTPPTALAAYTRASARQQPLTHMRAKRHQLWSLDPK
jgi:hypothetical protein